MNTSHKQKQAIARACGYYGDCRFRSLGVWALMFILAVIFSSCEKDCDMIEVYFKNKYSDRTLTLIVDGRERATLGPGDEISLRLTTGMHSRHFQGGCAPAQMELKCKDDGIQFFCPG